MGATITLYILSGCVGVAVVLFIVMIGLSVMRPRPLLDLSAYESTSEPFAAHRIQDTVVLAPPRSWFRTLGGAVAGLMLAVAPLAVAPGLLDPLCDDYEWAGAETVQHVREYALEAHAVIDLAP